MLKTVSSITNAIGALNYKGTWDANANSPALASSVGTKGDYYVVGTAGSTNLNGISNWGVGDLATFNGSVWQRVEGGADLNGVNLSVSGTSTLSGLTASTALALNASKEIVSVTNTGTGNNVLATSPTLSGTAAFASLSFTGQMNAAFGSVGAPSIYFNTDTTTGFYRHSSAAVGVAAGGVNAAAFGATSASVAGGFSGGSGFQVSGFSTYRASGASVSSPGDAAIYYNAATGYTLQARAGSSYDWSLINVGNANYIARNPTGTVNIEFLGGVAITGALSKGSGSFRIQHPLPEKKQTHDLVHSFIEGPKADLIYRGLVKLQDGLAQVNIDQVSGMTAGTFVALCREVQCFTSNETGWTALRGKVVGNVLSIESQQPCNDEVSWMVIGERQDEHMMSTDWTDDQGRVIVEPEKRLASDSSVPQIN